MGQSIYPKEEAHARTLCEDREFFPARTEFRAPDHPFGVVARARNSAKAINKESTIYGWIWRVSGEERLKAYPGLKAKIEAMLSIIENSGGDVEKAAEAERRMIEEWRQMGNEVLHRWARRQQQKKEEEHNAQPGVNRQEKKALLVQGAGKNRPRGGGLHPRTAGAGDPTLFRVGGGPRPGVLGSPAASPHRFRSRGSLCRGSRQAERGLGD